MKEVWIEPRWIDSEIRIGRRSLGVIINLAMKLRTRSGHMK